MVLKLNKPFYKETPDAFCRWTEKKGYYWVSKTTGKIISKPAGVDNPSKPPKTGSTGPERKPMRNWKNWMIGIASVFGAFMLISLAYWGYQGRTVTAATAATIAPAPTVASSSDPVLQGWMNGIRNTPAPKGTRWKRINPRATGEKGCIAGQTRVNPSTGRLQGCK